MEIITDKETWNRLVLNSSKTFFQSWEWGALQESLGRKAFRISIGGVPIAFYRYSLPLGKSYLYAPGVNFISGKNGTELQKKLRSSASDALFAKLESWDLKDELPSKPFRPGLALQPTELSIMDITSPEEEILKKMEHDTRYAIRAAEKRGVDIKIYSAQEEKREHFAEFWQLYSDLNERKKLAAHSKEYYRGVSELEGTCHSKLFIAYVESKPVNVALAVYFGDIAYYLFAASAQGFGKYNAPSLLLWRLIQDAKNENCTALNLGGISHTKASQKGLTEFKKSFGAAEIQVPGAADLPLRSIWYQGYCIAKRFV